MLISENLERALRYACVCHRGQVRKGSGTPYIEHVVGVAMALARLGFEEDVVVAGLLHDTVEDTEATLEEIRTRFGARVADLVGFCSEVKTEADGRKRPWEVRKRDHLAALAGAPEPARAIVLADKLHNLVSIICDLRDGVNVWSLFNAGRERVLWYYDTSLMTLACGSDERLDRLAGDCRKVLDEVRSFVIKS